MVYRFYIFIFRRWQKVLYCSIIDVHYRGLIASIIDKHNNGELAKCTLEKALDSQLGIDTSRLMHQGDQGSQYTSKESTEFCEQVGVTNSMSKAGRLYDNAPMERYFNTLKNELIYQHYYHDDAEIYSSID